MFNDLSAFLYTLECIPRIVKAIPEDGYVKWRADKAKKQEQKAKKRKRKAKRKSRR